MSTVHILKDRFAAEDKTMDKILSCELCFGRPSRAGPTALSAEFCKNTIARSAAEILTIRIKMFVGLGVATNGLSLDGCTYCFLWTSYLFRVFPFFGNIYSIILLYCSYI